jgi:hypothetical protein
MERGGGRLFLMVEQVVALETRGSTGETEIP